MSKKENIEDMLKDIVGTVKKAQEDDTEYCNKLINNLNKSLGLSQKIFEDDGISNTTRAIKVKENKNNE